MTHYSRRQILRDTVFGTVALMTGRLALAAPAGAKAADKVRKKGVCGGIHGAAGLAALKPGWFYSWGITNNIKPPAGVEWVPQIFPHSKDDIGKCCERVKAGGYKILMGFNEPDHPGQANMSVEKAVENWPKLMATGLRLISPGVTWAPNGWMKKFMREAEARKFRIDAVSIHWYGMPNADAFLSYVNQAHKDYGRPVWVTEFGINDKRATAEKPSKVTAQDVIRFLRVVLPAMEKLPWLERYCLYGPHHANSAKNGTSCLFGDDGKLTDVGEYFASVP